MSRRHTHASSLICVRINILWNGGISLVGASCLAALQQLQSRFDVSICGVEIGSASISI